MASRYLENSCSLSSFFQAVAQRSGHVVKAKMTISEFISTAFYILWMVALVIIGAAIVVGWLSSGNDFVENAPCAFSSLLLVLFLLMVSMGSFGEPPRVNHQIVRFWNRSGRTGTKSGRWQITDWRQPNPHLTPQEYLMGVEMAKNNACNLFNMGVAEDVERFRRCIHFFPDMLTEYKQHHQNKTGVVIN